MSRNTIRDILRMKKSGTSITMITAYDYTAARLIDEVGVPLILVGDSIGQTTLGYENTIPVTVDDIVSATAAVIRGNRKSFVVADMPFMSYQASTEDALRTAGRLLKEGGAQAVKLEGGAPVVESVRAITDAGIACMGHLGLTPQSVNQLGGYRVQGRDEDGARQMVQDALALQNAGAFSIVLELVPTELAAEITEALGIPTIGIGAGPECDGQVQVFHDIMGLSLDFTPRHARKFARVGDVIIDALGRYMDEVEKGEFPTEAESVRPSRPNGRPQSKGNVTELDVASGN
jgi:3-methyl-2-oxobutanoate hydroxymethyltransferase